MNCRGRSPARALVYDLAAHEPQDCRPPPAVAALRAEAKSLASTVALARHRSRRLARSPRQHIALWQWSDYLKRRSPARRNPTPSAGVDARRRARASAANSKRTIGQLEEQEKHPHRPRHRGGGEAPRAPRCGPLRAQARTHHAPSATPARGLLPRAAHRGRRCVCSPVRRRADSRPLDPDRRFALRRRRQRVHRD